VIPFAIFATISFAVWLTLWGLDRLPWRRSAIPDPKVDPGPSISLTLSGATTSWTNDTRFTVTGLTSAVMTIKTSDTGFTILKPDPITPAPFFGDGRTINHVRDGDTPTTIPGWASTPFYLGGNDNKDE
jgi:hypothetical protein